MENERIGMPVPVEVTCYFEIFSFTERLHAEWRANGK
jgi:hypothetical protein